MSTEVERRRAAVRAALGWIADRLRNLPATEWDPDITASEAFARIVEDIRGSMTDAEADEAGSA